MPARKTKTKEVSTKKTYKEKKVTSSGSSKLKGRKTSYGEKKSYARKTNSDGFKSKTSTVHSKSSSNSPYSNATKLKTKPSGKPASKSYAVSNGGSGSVFGDSATKKQYKTAKRSIKRGR